VRVHLVDEPHAKVGVEEEKYAPGRAASQRSQHQLAWCLAPAPQHQPGQPDQRERRPGEEQNGRVVNKYI
jgi:hypothetical protein